MKGSDVFKSILLVIALIAGCAAQAKPNFSTAYIFQAIAMALDGRVEQAGSRARRGLELEPDFKGRMFFELGLAQPLTEKFAAGSRLLGLSI